MRNDSKFCDDVIINIDNNLILTEHETLSAAATLPNLGANLFCRICLDTEEELLSPCNCTGTAAHVHLPCLEQWLSISRRNHCELCQFQYETKSTQGSLFQYFQDDEEGKKAFIPRLKKDLVWFLVLIMCSVLGCSFIHIAEGYFTDGISDVISTFLIILNVCVDGAWLLVTILFHLLDWRSWKKNHFSVKLVQSSGFV